MANSFVHSVNRGDISIDVGQLGVYTIKGAGSRISERTPICDRKVQKDYGERFDTIVIPGEDIAKDIIDRGKEDGFFQCEGKEPKPDELTQAVSAFKAICVGTVRHADALWERTRNREIISERARRAARFIGAAPEWLDQSLTDDKKKCPRCAELIKAEASWCKHCQYDLGSTKVAVPASR